VAPALGLGQTLAALDISGRASFQTPQDFLGLLGQRTVGVGAAQNQNRNRSSSSDLVRHMSVSSRSSSISSSRDVFDDAPSVTNEPPATLTAVLPRRPILAGRNSAERSSSSIGSQQDSLPRPMSGTLSNLASSSQDSASLEGSQKSSKSKK
jgi:hypothetical protein